MSNYTCTSCFSFDQERPSFGKFEIVFRARGPFLITGGVPVTARLALESKLQIWFGYEHPERNR